MTEPTRQEHARTLRQQPTPAENRRRHVLRPKQIEHRDAWLGTSGSDVIRVRDNESLGKCSGVPQRIAAHPSPPRP